MTRSKVLGCFVALATVLGGTIAGSARGSGGGGAGGFRLYWECGGTWSADYDVTALGYEPEHTVKMVYQADLGAFQEEFVKGPDIFDMDAYYDAVARAIRIAVPNPGFDGMLLFNYEEFPATLYDPWRAEFVDPRVEAVLANERLNPDGSMTWDEALEIAEWRYRPYSERCWLGTIAIARRLRPEAKVGFYSVGVIFGANQGITEETYLANQKQQWLSNRVDILCPSVYLWPPPTEEWTQNGVLLEVMDEALRVAEVARQSTGRRPRVIPFVACTWRGQSCVDEVCDYDYYTQSLIEISGSGVDGLLQWMTVYDDREPTKMNEAEYVDLIDTFIAPALEDANLGVFAD